MFWPMRSGIFREDEGFDIIVNGVARTFLYVEAVAYESALFHKQRHPAEVVEVRVRATGQRIVVLQGGRTYRTAHPDIMRVLSRKNEGEKICRSLGTIANLARSANLGP